MLFRRVRFYKKKNSGVLMRKLKKNECFDKGKSFKCEKQIPGETVKTNKQI